MTAMIDTVIVTESGNVIGIGIEIVTETVTEAGAVGARHPLKIKLTIGKVIACCYRKIGVGIAVETIVATVVAIVVATAVVIAVGIVVAKRALANIQEAEVKKIPKTVFQVSRVKMAQ